MMKLLKTGVQKFNETVLWRFAVAGIAFYLLLFCFNSLTRIRQFSPDSMNYVDVARNIGTGRGFVQTTLGFNQALLFDKDSQIPSPFTSQAPLYPLLIVLVNRFGFSYADAALIVPVIAYGIILVLVYFLALELYGKQTGLLSLSCFLIYSVLTYVSRYAWSESVSLVFLFVALLLLVRSRQFTRIQSIGINSFLAGLATGLAFDTRYALLPLFFLGTVFLVIEHRERKLTLAALLPFVIGTAIPTTLVLAHNLLSSGAIMPPTLPSDRPLLTNLGDAFYATFGNYFWKGSERTQATLALAVAAFSVLVLALQRRIGELVVVFVRERRYLLVLWFLMYSGFVIYQRTVQHFSAIGTRLMLPGGVMLILLGVALVVKVVEPTVRNTYAFYAILTAAILVACVREIRVALSQPPVNLDQQIAQSDRLTWVAQHTRDSDLVIGDNTMDIPFYFAGHAAVSFSGYPFTIHLTYAALRDFAMHNCNRYQHMYLILRCYDNWNYDDQIYHYGQFITDARLGNITKYPGILGVALLKDASVFEITCSPVNYAPRH
jgi:hypothetical protein